MSVGTELVRVDKVLAVLTEVIECWLSFERVVRMLVEFHPCPSVITALESVLAQCYRCQRVVTLLAEHIYILV